MSRKKKSRTPQVGAERQQSDLRRHDGPAVLTSAPRWMHRLAPLLVALVTLAVFLPTLQNQFVGWDDDVNFLDNPHYRGLGWTQLRWMWTTSLMGHYIPLTWMTLGMDYVLWGMNPFGYHLTSLLLHVANAAVFYVLVLRILIFAVSGRSERGYALIVSAGLAALVFAIHPLRVESVTWITSEPVSGRSAAEGGIGCPSSCSPVRCSPSPCLSAYRSSC